MPKTWQVSEWVKCPDCEEKMLTSAQNRIAEMKQPELPIECWLCEGQGGWKELISREWEFPKYTWSICWECWGEGKISELQRAISIRGYSVPIPFRGGA